jgi:hypothetical protein
MQPGFLWSIFHRSWQLDDVYDAIAIPDMVQIFAVEIIIRAEAHNSVWVAILFVVCLACVAVAGWSLIRSRARQQLPRELKKPRRRLS